MFRGNCYSSLKGGKLMRLKMTFTGRKEKNMSFSYGDRLSVINNRLTVALKENFGFFERRRLQIIPHGFSPNLVHKDNIIIITKNNWKNYDGVGIMEESSIHGDVVITNLENFPLLFLAADCFLVVLHEKEKSLLAMIHSGRAGTLANIGGKTIEAMRKEFGSTPKNIHAYIFPGICVDCYTHPT